MAIELIKVPDLGEADEVEVIELLVSVGQQVQENDSLLVLESDKAAMEIPAPMAGVVHSIAVNLGDQLSSGSDMLTLEVNGSGEEATDPATPPTRQEEAKAPSPDSAANNDVISPPVATEAAAIAAATTTAAPAAATSDSMLIDVPELGTDDEVEVIEIHVQQGAVVAVDDSLITLESDKAAMEVPAPRAGTVAELLLAVGDKVKTGSPILRLSVDASAAQEHTGSESTTPAIDNRTGTAPAMAATPATEAAPKASPAPATQEHTDSESTTPAIDNRAGSAPAMAATPATEAAPKASPTADQDRVYAGPATRKLARELGVDLRQVSGSGIKSRIVKDDVHDFVKQRLDAPAVGAAPTVPDIDFSQFGAIEQQPLSRLHKTTAANMHRNWNVVPHVAQFHKADVTDLEAFRQQLRPEAEKRAVKLTFLPFLLKACANALREYPRFNVSLHSSGEYLVQKKYFHIGMAVATEAGLVVPVIRDVDRKTIWELAAEVAELTARAKQRKLTMEQMQGACFTISSLGAIGGTGFIPIVNTPEVAILGVARTAVEPVFMDGEFKPRTMLPLTLSYDHRAVNGVDGGLFANYLVKVLEDLRHLSM